MDDLDGILQPLVLIELGADQRLVPEDEETKVAMTLMRTRGSRQHHRRAGIATHRVDCDPWR
jgi:hypothetical protein